MINIQILRKSSVKAKFFLAGLITLTGVLASETSFADYSNASNFSGSNRTRIILHKVKPGESEDEIYSKFGISGAHKVVSSNRDHTRLMIISTETPREFKGFSSEATESSRYPNFGRRFNRYTHKFNMMRLASAQGTITTNLREAGKKAGLSEELIDQLTRIFGWDIDFATNLNEGDRFTVVYEKGGYNGLDDIVAAEFINNGKPYRAVRFIDKEGFANYYTPEGNELQKAFLSTPVDFARISSGFDMHRFHPVLNRIRAHKGVDYAARTGTPVKATGSGEISFLGNKGGYGQVIFIKHGDRYETVYAHLSNFRSGLHEGSHIRQGDIIGYVGQTGLATGPHLHYEFRINGVHQNPLTAKLSSSIPAKGISMAEFKSQVQDPIAKLNLAKAHSLFARSYSNYNN